MNLLSSWEITEPFFRWLLQASFQASIIVGLVLLLQLALGEHLSARWRHALWFIVLARLLLPISVESRFSLFNFVNADMARSGSKATESALEMSEMAALAEESPHGTQSPSENANRSQFAMGLSLVWLIGVIAFPAYALAGSWSLTRKVRRQRPIIKEPILNLLESCKTEMEVRTPLTLVETPAVCSPSLFGFVRPRLLLPAGFTSAFSTDEMRYVFLHELAHVKRGDIPWRWAATA